jgi:hypothetical protein
MDQDILFGLYNSIPDDAHCESQKEVQQKIMQACWTYNKLITDKVQCSVCKWRNAIKPQIAKYLKGIGKI